MATAITTALYDANLKETGKVNLNGEIFGESKKPYLWHEAVKWQLAARRQGTHDAKERNQISGSTRKIYRQKGTGRARHGNIKAPIFVGGGRVHPPHPRDYWYGLTKETRRVALRSALSAKLKDNLLKVVESLTLKEGKTKEAISFLAKAKFKSALVVDNDNRAIARGVGNLKEFKYLKPEGVNVYDLMKYEGVIISKQALEAIEQRLS